MEVGEITTVDGERLKIIKKTLNAMGWVYICEDGTIINKNRVYLELICDSENTEMQKLALKGITRTTPN